MAVPEMTKQNITVRLDRGTLRKAKVLAARRKHVDQWYAAWCVDGITPADVSMAFQIEDRARVGFWDAPRHPDDGRAFTG